MRTIWKYSNKIVANFFILLFCYAAVSKMLDFENFQVQLAQSPLLSSYAGFISYGVIAVEIVIAIQLVFLKSRTIGFYASFGLMVAFTVYIYLILHHSEFVPCSCGGILEDMGWTAHLIFNTACVIIVGAVLLFGSKNQRKNQYKTLATIGIIFLVCVGGMITLFLSSEYMIRRENNFTRRFLQNPITEKRSMTLEENRYYFAGIDGGRIYLGNIKKPLILTSVNLELQDFKEMKIVPEKVAEFVFRNLRVQVKDGWYYLADGTVPIIYRGSITEPEAKIISKDEVYFTQMEVVDSLHFVMRSQSSKSHEYVLAQLNLDQVPRLSVFDGLLEKQIDGVFDVDGILKTDEGKVVYMYYYRNQFLVFNKQMQLLHQLQTIDPTKIAQISVLKLKDGSRRMDAPPIKVNENVTLYKNMVFNISNMRGQFETYNEWKRYSVVDIYKSDMQYYIGSFRVKKTLREEKGDLIVTDHSFYLIAGGKLKQFTYNKSMRELTKRGEAENLDQE